MAEHVIKFFISIDGLEIEVPREIVYSLALNNDGCLNWFLCGYYKNFEPSNIVPFVNLNTEPWSK